ncbi:MAG: hypothetical protein J6M19_00125 [Bacteroidaceae bacterium]|nr:hypothetical protein [Bacteroidaceae bacterium]
MRRGILTKGQLQNIVKFIYDVCKLVAAGGIITPFVKNETIDLGLMQGIVAITFILFFVAVLLDGVADRMGDS